jgi:hypothetical protein
VFAVGGPELAGIEPDSGPPVPGSYGEKIRATRPVVSRDEYMDRIGERLAALVLSGGPRGFLGSRSAERADGPHADLRPDRGAEG